MLSFADKKTEIGNGFGIRQESRTDYSKVKHQAQVRRIKLTQGESVMLSRNISVMSKISRQLFPQLVVLQLWGCISWLRLLR